jgi:hypothetical protein
MDDKNSTIFSNIADKNNIEQASDSMKDASIRQRFDLRMMQSVLLTWLDTNMDDNNEDSRNMVTQLRCAINTVNTFTDADQCIDFLTDIHNEKVFLIISGTLCQNVVPLIHDVAQLHTIFIFRQTKARHEQWSKKWPKIRGLFTEILPLCEAIKQATRQYEQSDIPMSFVPTDSDLFTKKLDQLDCSFMYTQILKEILLTIEFEVKHIKEFIDYCCDVFTGNDHDLNKIKTFEQKYHDETPIWWYTSEAFLYPMLNRALRLMDVNIIIKMGFFVNDLHHQIQQLHSQQFNQHNWGNCLTVYRGQGVSKKDFDQMKKTKKGGLMSFNNFLSTSKNREVSLLFAESNLSNPDSVSILFVITVDPSKSTNPFASTNGVTHFPAKMKFSFQCIQFFAFIILNQCVKVIVFSR